MVAATSPRNNIRHIGNRSCGRTPKVNANDAMPGGVDAGKVKMKLGIDVLTKSGELGSAIWSAKVEGGEKGPVRVGEKCCPWEEDVMEVSAE